MSNDLRQITFESPANTRGSPKWPSPRASRGPSLCTVVSHPLFLSFFPSVLPLYLSPSPSRHPLLLRNSVLPSTPVFFWSRAHSSSTYRVAAHRARTQCNFHVRTHDYVLRTPRTTINPDRGLPRSSRHTKALPVPLTSSHITVSPLRLAGLGGNLEGNGNEGENDEKTTNPGGSATTIRSPRGKEKQGISVTTTFDGSHTASPHQTKKRAHVRMSGPRVSEAQN